MLLPILSPTTWENFFSRAHCTFSRPNWLDRYHDGRRGYDCLLLSVLSGVSVWKWISKTLNVTFHWHGCCGHVKHWKIIKHGICYYSLLFKVHSFGTANIRPIRVFWTISGMILLPNSRFNVFGTCCFFMKILTLKTKNNNVR